MVDTTGAFGWISSSMARRKELVLGYNRQNSAAAAALAPSSSMADWTTASVVRVVSVLNCSASSAGRVTTSWGGQLYNKLASTSAAAAFSTPDLPIADGWNVCASMLWCGCRYVVISSARRLDFAEGLTLASSACGTSADISGLGLLARAWTRSGW